MSSVIHSSRYQIIKMKFCYDIQQTNFVFFILSFGKKKVASIQKVIVSGTFRQNN